MKLDPSITRVLVALVIPVLVGLATKVSASDRIKAVVMIVLAAVGALVVNATQSDGSAVLSAAMLSDWAITTATAVAAYLGVLKPLTNGALNSRLAPTIGLG